MTDERTANAIDRKIGQKVRTRRLEIGMSQERLAELLGVTFQQVQKYEKGVNRIAASRLADIAEALDRPAAWFFPERDGRKRELDTDEPIAELLATADGLRIVRAAAGANKKLRNAMANALEGMAGAAT